ncbi:MAG: hypothetical protein QG597_4827 [Actinomycetota bacterium]|nr:hypothetical protein [Actinomycetota bacterium]
MAPHDHPLFTQLYRVLARVEDSGPVGRARTQVSAQLHGRLLIVGLGPAEDLHHLPAAVTEVVGIEPSGPMRRAAEPAVAKARAAGLPVEVIDAVGEDLPLPDSSVDSVLFAYVLCTVDDPARAVAEARRVLRPGGTVGVLEHVAGPPGSWMRRAQRVVSPVWPKVAGGCRCDRDTRAELAAGGFDVSELDDFLVAPLVPVGAGLKGVATAPLAGSE